MSGLEVVVDVAHGMHVLHTQSYVLTILEQLHLIQFLPTSTESANETASAQLYSRRHFIAATISLEKKQGQLAVGQGV